MVVNLIKKGNEFVEKKAIYTSLEKVVPTDGKQTQDEFKSRKNRN